MGKEDDPRELISKLVRNTGDTRYDLKMFNERYEEFSRKQHCKDKRYANILAREKKRNSALDEHKTNYTVHDPVIDAYQVIY